jgi:hypothetical protein
MNKIILFNEYHYGDIFFTVEIIKNIIKCNPHLKIYIMNKENAYSLFNNIENIEGFLKPTSYNKNQYAWQIIDDTIIINMWCAGGRINASSTSVIEQQNRIMQILFQINHFIQDINFKYKPLTNTELIPKLNLSILPDSIQNKLNYNDKRIFYYNVTPRSGQYNGIKINHNNNITKLCNEFKDYYVIIPKSADLEYPNLVCLEKYGIIESPEAENVIQSAQIARNCQHIILYECGVCLPAIVNNNNNLYIIRLDSKISFSEIMNQRETGKEITKELSKENLLDKELIRIII